MAGGKDLFAPAPPKGEEKRKGKDLFSGTAPPMSTRETESFPVQKGLEGVSLQGAYPQRAGDLQGVRDYLSQSQAEDDARAAERKALETSADAAAAQAGQSYAADAMFLDRTDRMSYQERARQNVWDQAGIMSPEDAFTARAGNSALFGLPGLLNERARGAIRQAGQEQPGSALAGDIAGYLVPGEAVFQAGKAATNAFARPIVSRIMPQGGSAIERGTRFAGRYGAQTGAWAGQNALYQGTVGESVRAAEEGRDPSLSAAAGAAGEGATDPLNALGPAALMGLNRLREYAVTGGRSATPRSVADSVAEGRGAPTSGSVLNAGRLGGGDVDGRAETLLIRMLRNAGYSRDDISRGLATFDSLADQTSDLPVLASRLKDVLIDQLGPRAEQVVQDFLQGAGVSRGGTAGQAVQDAAQQDYGRLSDFLEASANARLGEGSRWDTLTGAQDEMTRIGHEGYERVFGAPPTNQEGVADLRQALDFYANSELATPLRQVAAGRMLNVEQMIEADPRRAAHWMQHTAGLRAQEAADAGNEVLARAYTDMRNQILRRLEADGVAPGYQQARMQFGDQFGIEQAVNFGSRFFTRVQDSVGVRRLAEDIRNLTPQQQEAALLSIRDELLRLAGRGREGAAPRLSQLNTESALGGLETVVGERGGQLANDIRFIDERLARIRRTDPTANSRTATNTEAREFADRAVSNPITRTIGNAINAIGGDAALASVASGGTVPPVFSIRAGMRAMGDRMARGRQGKIDDVTALLLRDYGGVPRPGMPGDAMPPLTSRGGPTGGGAPQVENAFAQTMSNQQTVQPARTNAFRNNQSGNAGIETTSVIAGPTVGAYGGYSLPADSEEERLRNTLLGAGFGLSLGVGVSRASDYMSQQPPRLSKPRPEKPGDLDRALERGTVSPEERAMLTGQPAPRRTPTPTNPKRAKWADKNVKDAIPNRVNDPEYEAARKQAKLTPEELEVLLRGEDADIMPSGFSFAPRKTRAEPFNDPRLTASENKAVEMRRNGFTVPEMADEMDTSEDAVYKFIQTAKAKGIDVGEQGRDRVRDSILELASKRVSVSAIAQRLGISPNNVKVVLANARKQAGDNMPDWLRPRALAGGLSPEAEASVTNAFAQSVMGGAGGSALGSRTDLNGDGVIDEQDIFIGSAAGTVGVPAAAMGMRRTNAFAPDASTMGAGGRKPPPDSPDAITEAVRGMARDTPKTPQNAFVPPRGNMRGVIQMPERVPPASPMAGQVPPPLPPRPQSMRLPSSDMPNATEMGLMVGTAGAIGGAYMMEQAINDPRTFGLASFEELAPDDPLRDPAYRHLVLLSQIGGQDRTPVNAFAQ